MAKYIDREAAIKAVEKNDCEGHATWAIRSVPVADVAPVRHGQYITDDMGDSSCSECGANWLDITQNYCPNCGARLDGEDDDYERPVEQMEYDMLYEPTYNPKDGSM